MEFVINLLSQQRLMITWSSLGMPASCTLGFRRAFACLPCRTG
jgi:hypothetical protein